MKIRTESVIKHNCFQQKTIAPDCPTTGYLDKKICVHFTKSQVNSPGHTVLLSAATLAEALVKTQSK